MKLVQLCAKAFALAYLLSSLPSFAFFDDFNRPDADTLGSNWTLANGSADIGIRNGEATIVGSTGNVLGIVRPLFFSVPVTVSADIKALNGYAGLLDRFDALIGILSDGNANSGYRVVFGRSDQISNNSIVQLYDGPNLLASVSPGFQYTGSIHVSVTFNLDRSITGVVRDSQNAFPFNFGPRTIQSSGTKFLFSGGSSTGRVPGALLPSVDNLLIHQGVTCNPSINQLISPPLVYDNVGKNWGQTFTAVSKSFSGVRVFVGDPTRPISNGIGPLMGPAELVLFDADTATELARSEVLPANAVVSGEIDLLLQQPVATQIGKKYYFAIDSNNISPAYGIGLANYLSTYVDGSEAYIDAGGTIVEHYMNRDLSFNVYDGSCPAPGSPPPSPDIPPDGSWVELNWPELGGTGGFIVTDPNTFTDKEWGWLIAALKAKNEKFKQTPSSVETISQLKDFQCHSGYISKAGYPGFLAEPVCAGSPGYGNFGSETSKAFTRFLVGKGVVKLLPSGWVVQVSRTSESNTNKITKHGTDSYRWYQVKDVTDKSEGWMVAGKTDSNNTFTEQYLAYSSSNQKDLEDKASPFIDAGNIINRKNRAAEILRAVENYRDSANPANELEKSKNLTLLTSIPKELILAIVIQESGHDGDDFDNEIVSYDYGHGVMQNTFVGFWTEPWTERTIDKITSLPKVTVHDDKYFKNDSDPRGEASQVIIPQCASIGSSLYRDCYANSGIHSGLSKPYKAYKDDSNNPLYRQYVNSKQSIFANVKDGLNVLLNKYLFAKRKIGNKVSWTNPVEAKDKTKYPVSAEEMVKIATVKGYNGFKVSASCPLLLDNNNTPDYISHVADKLLSVSDVTNFSVPAFDNSNELIEKMKAVDYHRTEIKICSPGTLRIIDDNGVITGGVGADFVDQIPLAFYNTETGKEAVTYLSNNSYKYQVIGTDPGVYAFNIVNVTPDGIQPIYLQNIPLALGETYTYQVDWDAIARNEKGVQVSIDHKGDGTNVDTFFVSANLNDTLPPVSTASASGINGLNGWYTSDVGVTLTASDGDGAGVKSTYFSLDNGSTWQLYDNYSDIHFTDEGTHTVQYYSIDFLGYQEAVQTLTIKIDKTAPEARISADPAGKKLGVSGIDNLSNTTVANDASGNFIVTDEAGHTVKLFFASNSTSTKRTSAVMTGMQYDNAAVTPFSNISFNYTWNQRSAQPLMTQKIYGKDVFNIQSEYQKDNDMTTLEIETPSVHLPTQNYPGSKIVTITTTKGALGYTF